MKSYLQLILQSAIVLLALALSPMVAAQDQESFQADPYALGDHTWISISGTVASVSRHAFDLDYGDGVITVEMDDDNRDADAYELTEGDKVRVGGLVDDSFFEKARIVARQVFVEKTGTVFYARPTEAIAQPAMPVFVPETVIRGRVSNVGAEQFTIDSGLRKITVDVTSLPENPLDNIGYQKIRRGDTVSVSGSMDSNFIDGSVLVASSVTTLYDK
ncbi:MAG: OB-fold nucleic acid binding domain-containing protein [Wenzhouxiangellaceae bacterium]|nr:OB-fold nucleic acid binding domain-containing protein [Wenzhouxiangellaceae bacterium]